MAYRRSLITSSRLLLRQRFAPAFSCTHHDYDHNDLHSDDKVKMSFLQSRSFGSNTNTWLRFGGGCMSFRDPKPSQFVHGTSGFLFARHMSTMNGDGNGEEKIGCMAEKTMEVVSSQAAAVSPEVALAAADSWPPVAFLQYALDGIHTYTGLNWWASIVIATLVTRTLLIPFMIRTSKYMSLMDQDMQFRRDWEGLEKLYNEHRVSPVTPLKGLFIQSVVFVTSYLAIQNMVEKVPSFQTGGISWFIDLTTTDTSYILPCLVAASLWCIVQEQEGDPFFITNKHIVLLTLCPVSVLLAAHLPNAFLCYWITFHSFSYVYKRLIKRASVKKFLKIESTEEVMLREARERYAEGMRNKQDESNY